VINRKRQREGEKQWDREGKTQKERQRKKDIREYTEGRDSG
jgi:hypothetical protein